MGTEKQKREIHVEIGVARGKERRIVAFTFPSFLIRSYS